MVLGEKVVDAVRDHLVPAVLSSSADQRANISEDTQFAVSKEGLEK
jgi:hypothetical protein